MYRHDVNFERLMAGPIDDYLQTISEALADRPLQLGEADVQEWISRLDTLRMSHRIAEVEHVHQALRLVFTSGEDDKTPLDLRIHRRLGEMYLEKKNGAEA